MVLDLRAVIAMAAKEHGLSTMIPEIVHLSLRIPAFRIVSGNAGFVVLINRRRQRSQSFPPKSNICLRRRSLSPIILALLTLRPIYLPFESPICPSLYLPNTPRRPVCANLFSPSRKGGSFPTLLTCNHRLARRKIQLIERMSRFHLLPCTCILCRLCECRSQNPEMSQGKVFRMVGNFE